jgi:type IV pilus assembly protein PilF
MPRPPFYFLLLIFGLTSACATGSKSNLTKVERARQFLEVAGGALSEGDPTVALHNLSFAEDLAPELPEVHHAKALAYYAKGELETAFKEAALSVKLNPQYSAGNNTLGKLYMDQGRYADAFPLLTRAAKDPLNPEAFKAYTNLGILHYRKGEFSKSKIELDKAVLNSKDYSCVAYYYRGHLAMRNGQFNEAIRDYSSATRKTCSRFVDAYLALGLAYQKSGQYGMARRTYIEIQQQFPATQYAAQAVRHLQNLP